MSTVLCTIAAFGVAVAQEAPAGLGKGGSPEPLLTGENVELDDKTLACADARWQPGSDGLWSFEQIAESFVEFGIKKFYKPGTGPDPVTQCVGALTIAAGECQETRETLGKGCDAQKTGHSGVYQLDYMRTAGPGNKVNPQIEKDGGIMNLCVSGFGAGFMTGAPLVDSAHVANLEGSSFITCMAAPDTVNEYSCPDPSAVGGTTYANFIGTFCHKGHLSRWSPCPLSRTGQACCGIWNGGANPSQGPFPDYYYGKAKQHLDSGADFEAICKSAVSAFNGNTSLVV